jgi:hypothetical protein
MAYESRLSKTINITTTIDSSPAHVDEADVFRQVYVDRLSLPQGFLHDILQSQRIAIGAFSCTFLMTETVAGDLLVPEEGGLHYPLDLVSSWDGELRYFLLDVHFDAHIAVLIILLLLYQYHQPSIPSLHELLHILTSKSNQKT